MSAISPKTGERAQWSAGFSIGLKTGDVLELTISMRKQTAVLWASSIGLDHQKHRAARFKNQAAPSHCCKTKSKPTTNLAETRTVPMGCVFGSRSLNGQKLAGLGGLWVEV